MLRMLTHDKNVAKISPKKFQFYPAHTRTNEQTNINDNITFSAVKGRRGSSLVILDI